MADEINIRKLSKIIRAMKKMLGHGLHGPCSWKTTESSLDVEVDLRTTRHESEDDDGEVIP